MKFEEFRDTVITLLRKNPDGLTWNELKDFLPYERPCPNWVSRLEMTSGLIRVRRKGRSFIWELNEKQP